MLDFDSVKGDIMTLLIAILVIVGLGLPGWLIPVATVVWVGHLIFHVTT